MIFERQINWTNYYYFQSNYYEYLYLNIDPCDNYTLQTSTTATTTILCGGSCNTTQPTTVLVTRLKFCNSTTTKYVTIINQNKNSNSVIQSNSTKRESVLAFLILFIFLIKYQ
jgi:hypothetical protein